MIELIESIFGKVVLEKNGMLEEHTLDIVIHPDGTINDRNWAQICSISDRRIGQHTGHAIWKEELDWEFENEDLDTLFIGTGMNGRVQIPDETIEHAERMGMHIVSDLTPRIISKFNKSKAKKAAILHLTC